MLPDEATEADEGVGQMVAEIGKIFTADGLSVPKELIGFIGPKVKQET